MVNRPGRFHTRAIVAAALACVTICAAACSGRSFAPGLPPFAPAPEQYGQRQLGSGPAIVFDSDQSIILPSRGSSFQFAAHLQGGSGRLTWRSMTPSLVSVDSAGKATAQTNLGSASIVVSAPGAQDAVATVLVAAPNPGTVIVSSTDVVSTSPNLQYPTRVVLKSDAVTKGIHAGSILVSGNRGGLLVKVTSVAASNGKIVAGVTSSSLAQAFSEMNVSLSGATSRYSGAKEGTDFVLRDRLGDEVQRVPLSDFKCTNTSGGSVGISITAPSLTVSPSVTPNFDLQIVHGSVTVFNLTMTVTVATTLKSGSISAAGAVKASFTCSAELAEITIAPFPIGPFILYPTVNLTGGIEGALSTEASITFDGPSFTKTNTVEAGIKYASGKWDVVKEAKQTGTGTLGSWPKPKAKISGSLGPFVQAELGLNGCLGAFAVCVVDLIDTAMASANVSGKLEFSLSTPFDYHNVAYTGPAWDLAIELVLALKAEVRAGKRIQPLLDKIGATAIKVPLATLDFKVPIFANPATTSGVTPSDVSPHDPLNLKSSWNCPTLPCIVNYRGKTIEFLLYPPGAVDGTPFGSATAVAEKIYATTTASAPGCPATNPYNVRAFLFGDIFGPVGLPYPSPQSPFNVICPSPSPSPSTSPSESPSPSPSPLTNYPLAPFYGYPQFITEYVPYIGLPRHGNARAHATGGSLWFTIQGPTPAIGEIATDGTITEYSGLDSSSNPGSIAQGADGNLWFTDTIGSGAIGKMTTMGSVAEYSTGLSGKPTAIALGPDGNMWFTERSNDKIGRITTNGSIGEYSTGLTPLAGPDGIVAGPDHNLWFAENSAGKIGQITTNGTIAEFSTGLLGATPGQIAAGPDGNLWFTECVSYPAVGIGKITTAGAITSFTTGINAKAGPLAGISAGPDNSLWFTESGTANIGAIATTGSVTEYTTGITVAGIPLGGIALGPDGNLWFVETNNQAVGRFIPTPPALRRLKHKT